jgi:hypothetical protein
MNQIKFMESLLELFTYKLFSKDLFVDLPVLFEFILIDHFFYILYFFKLVTLVNPSTAP